MSTLYYFFSLNIIMGFLCPCRVLNFVGFITGCVIFNGRTCHHLFDLIACNFGPFISLPAFWVNSALRLYFVSLRKV